MKQSSIELRVSDLGKRYFSPGAELQVLRRVSFQLAAGQSLAVLGPSGSGKSTLLSIIATLERPTAGAVQLGDTDLLSLAGDQLARFRSSQVGFVFQDHHLLPQCTALENLLLPILASRSVRPADTDRAMRLLHEVGLQDRAHHLPGQLSGGERQRVAVARALINRPALLLCDEPTGNLDAANAQSVGQLLQALATGSGAILLVVTHSAALAATFDRQAEMIQGTLHLPPLEHTS